MPSFDDDELPGGSGYKDMTSILARSASEISQGGMLAMHNFTLHDAMMAIEVMDPRMDSGVERPEYPKGSFDPYSLLLPEEVCWIIDRTFAAEMSWYGGQSFSQSVFTCLYVHEVVPGRMWYGSRSAVGTPFLDVDARRPIQLLSLVLKAAIYGLLKSCDLAWRELTKGYVIEMEDFNGEKSDRFICETIQENEVLGMLDAAKLWLLSKEATTITMRAELIARIELRRAILTTLSPSSDISRLPPALRVAQAHIRDLRTFAMPPVPADGSPARRAFDPAIAHRLLSVMPLKIVSLPEQVDVWNDYFLLVSRLQEVCVLAQSPSMIQIKEFLELWAYQPPLANRFGIVRSLAYTTLLIAKGELWADNLYKEMTGVSLEAFTSIHPVLIQQTPLSLKASIDKMTQEYFASFFCNRPRQRRKLCNWMGHWAMLPFQLQDLMKSASSLDPEKLQSCHQYFLGVSVLRLSAAGHITLSGLELDIHDDNELPYVLWHGVLVYSTLNDALKDLKAICEQTAPTMLDHLFYEMMWSSLMGQYLMACCTTSLLLKRTPDMSLSREKTNFYRRFKWAFGADNYSGPSERKDPCTPKFEEWMAFRELQGQAMPWERAQACATLFQKLEQSLRAYEKLVQAEHEIGTEGYPRPPQTVQGHSARLRLEILKEMRETASGNAQGLLAIREQWPRHEAHSDKASSTPAVSEATLQLPLFQKKADKSRWFPTVC